MKFMNCESTWICQLNKKRNRAMLEDTVRKKDKSAKALVELYKFVINTLKDTDAWGVAGVNKMLNEFTAQVKATINKDKRGKTSAYAKAAALLRKIDDFKNFNVTPKNYGKCELDPLYTEEELNELRGE